MPTYHIRKATEADIPAVYDLMIALADYEKSAHMVINSRAQFAEDFRRNAYQLWVAEQQERIVGMALCYLRYSTWRGQCLYLEDLMVTEAARGQGIGKALLDTLIAEAKHQNYPQIMWQVLDWNAPAIAFYERLGAVRDPQWVNCYWENPQYKNA